VTEPNTATLPLSPRPTASLGGVPVSVHVALFLVQVWFASFGVAGKIALRELAPRGLIAVRVTLATLVFLLAWALRGRERIAPRDHLRIAFYALLGITFNQLLFIEGLKRTSATNAVVLSTSIPVFTVAMALLLRRERATRVKLLGLGIAFAGALTVTGGAHLEGGTHLYGNLLILCNSLSYSLYLVLSRDVLGRYHALTVIAFTFFWGTLGVLPFGAPAFVDAAPHLSRTTWLAIAYIVALPSVGTYFLNTFALARVEASLVAIYIYIQPIIGAALAAQVLGERPASATLLGGSLIFLGIWWVTRDARRRRR